jgi:hypothetical protein
MKLLIQNALADGFTQDQKEDRRYVLTREYNQER